ncbi:MAG: hypothetical protein ACKOFW_21470 [Planctomycetaceae bacterium]
MSPPADETGPCEARGTQCDSTQPATSAASQPQAGQDAPDTQGDSPTTALLTLSRASCQGESWQVVPPLVSLAAAVQVAGVRLALLSLAEGPVSDRQPRAERAPPIPPPKLG